MITGLYYIPIRYKLPHLNLLRYAYLHIYCYTCWMKKGILIAVIEDEPSICEMYRLKLSSSGFDVKTAHNGKEGLELLEKFKPALILLDLKMPVMTGDEMLAKLRETDWGAEIRVIVLTNISRDEAPKGIQFLNIDRYIVKAHHTPSQVVEMVKDILS